MASRYQLWALFWTLITVVSASRIPQWQNTVVIPATQSDENTNAKFIATSGGLDAPHVHPINASAYEWFYFDAVSEDGKYTVVVIFYTAPETGFPSGGPPNSIVPVSLRVGTAQNSTFFNKKLSGQEAIVKSVGNGASGDWVGTGFQFQGSPDLREYTIDINSPDDGDVQGSVKFEAVAPPHYPCGPVKAGVSMEAMPHLGWAIGISDARTEIDLVVNGTSVKFTGVGYHDKNWGDIPFAVVLQKSIWGHGRVGPYSIVWSVVTERSTGKEYSNGYIARDGRIVSFGCSALKVTTTSNPANYHVEIDLGHEGTFQYDTKEVAQIDGDDSSYGRFTGKLSGGIKGQQQYTGVALYEHFSL